MEEQLEEERRLRQSAVNSKKETEAELNTMQNEFESMQSELVRVRNKMARFEDKYRDAVQEAERLKQTCATEEANVLFWSIVWIIRFQTERMTKLYRQAKANMQELEDDLNREMQKTREARKQAQEAGDMVEKLQKENQNMLKVSFFCTHSIHRLVCNRIAAWALLGYRDPGLVMVALPLWTEVIIAYDFYGKSQFQSMKVSAVTTALVLLVMLSGKKNVNRWTLTKADVDRMWSFLIHFINKPFD